MIIAIVAMTKDRVIGLDGKIPWDVKEDLSLFKKKTINNVVIMGRKTYESIGKPLPNRINIVISSDKGYKAGDAVVCNSIEQGLEFAKKIINKDIYIIGGSTIYRQCMKYIDKICVSYIKKIIRVIPFSWILLKRNLIRFLMKVLKNLSTLNI
ncbi:dihydrofolate reductase [Cetobacterium sp. 2A]|uniref:dihydrofolate reductase n=1 Tax=Cetobacterium sp. 2A TaxID=2754723 RepID=UPI00163CC073|nr:dihydrofolate reductase [Cetobacterium sp. 2A]MBC2857226.1 dihydrofolate reductase [Cetobacterium sp. 2A]